ncbi:MAG: hypothetical protein ACRDD4_03195 [Culicoidibacterales bacterium]
MEKLKEITKLAGIVLVSGLGSMLVFTALGFGYDAEQYYQYQELQLEAEATQLKNDQMTIEPYQAEYESELTKVTKTLENSEAKLKQLQADVAKKSAELGATN